MLTKLLKISLFLFSLLIFGFLFWRFGYNQLLPKQGHLSVNTPFQSALVYLDGQKLGTSPLYLKNLPIGDHTIKLESDNVTWETKTTLSQGTFSTLELSFSDAKEFDSGENLFFTRGEKALIVTSKPTGAKVFLNGEEKGTTPVKISVSSGVNSLSLKKDGYLERQLNPNITEGYRTTANIFLAVDPFGQVEKIDASSKLALFSLFNSTLNLAKDFETWAIGVEQVQKQLSNTGTRFDLLLDSTGKTYILNQTEWGNKVKSKAVGNIGYLSSKKSDSLSPEANKKWQDLKAQFD